MKKDMFKVCWNKKSDKEREREEENQWSSHIERERSVKSHSCSTLVVRILEINMDKIIAERSEKKINDQSSTLFFIAHLRRNSYVHKKSCIRIERFLSSRNPSTRLHENRSLIMPMILVHHRSNSIDYQSASIELSSVTNKDYRNAEVFLFSPSDHHSDQKVTKENSIMEHHFQSFHWQERSTKSVRHRHHWSKI